MNNGSLPTASTPRPTDNIVVLSQRAPDQGEIILEAPQGDIPDAGCIGGKTPMGSNDGGRNKFGPQPNTTSEPPVVPDFVRRPLATRGEPSVPMAFFHPEASDNLLEALRGASIDEEHHTIMSVVVKKVRSTKSGLTEACASLLTGFEVSNQIMRKCYSIDSSP